MKKIVLIDGHNLLFRMFYGIPASIKNTKGKEIKGLIGFIGSIKKITNELKPDSLFVVFDSETSKNNNLKVQKNYKNNRIDYTNIPEEENPFSQLAMIKKALAYLNIPYLEIEEYEADDYIASIIANKKSKKNQFIIVSTDSDFIQLIDKNTYLFIPRGKKSILLDEEKVRRKYNISPKKYILYKALVGDRSDNIKGIKGIGSITASKIVNYASLPSYIKSNPNSRISKLLKENVLKIEENILLITLDKELDTSFFKMNSLDKKITSYKTYEIIERIELK